MRERGYTIIPGKVDIVDCLRKSEDISATPPLVL